MPALDGAIATRYADGTNEYDVRVRLPRERFRSAEDVGAVALFAGQDRPIYLRDVADVRLGLGPTSILRVNQNRQLRITADVNDDVTTVGAVTREVSARLADLTLPEGYALLYGGEEEAIRENQRNLLIVAVLAVFLVFIVMTVQYEKLTSPLAILVSIPLALVGVVLALWLTTTPLSAPVLLGVILLAGIVVNNAILLIHFIKGHRAAGLSAVAAAGRASRDRLRAILISSTTTIVGLLPLLAETSTQAVAIKPLVISVVFGLLSSTVLVLLVIPALYVLFDDWGWTDAPGGDQAASRGRDGPKCS